jgi:diguanylate cyclase (GGDEF)-like protein/PAS domain S-box-containing protein
MDDSERELNSQVKICIALTQPTKVLLATPNIYELLGFNVDDFLAGNVTLQSRIHAHDQDIADVLFSTDSNAASGSINIRLRHADGRIRCIKGEYTKSTDTKLTDTTAMDITGSGVTLALLLQDAKDLWRQQEDQFMMSSFAAMLDNTGDYIFFKDRNHVFTGANQTLVSTKNCANVIGQTDYDLFSEFLADIYYSLEKRVFASSKAEYEVQEILDADGNKGWVDNRKYPIKNDNGEIIGLFGMARNITESKRVAAALAEYKERLSLAIASNGIGVWDWDLQTLKLKWDDSMYLLFDIPQTDFNGSFEAWEATLHPDDRVRAEQEVQDAISGKKTFNTEFRIIFKSGIVRHIRAVAKVFRDENGKPLRMLGTNIDITQQKKADSEMKLAAIIFESQESMMVTDANCIILRINKAFTKITGYEAAEVIGKTPKFLNSGKQNKAFYTAMWESIVSQGIWEGEVYNRRKNGEIYITKLSVSEVKDSVGVITNYVSIHTDITSSKAAADTIEMLAYYDSLTQLPNRRLLLDKLNQALGASSRSGQRGALVFLDLDNFKSLNDTLGHSFGDLLLQQVAARLTASVRRNDTVSRIGGDEFVILLESLSGNSVEAATQAKIVAEKIISILNEPYTLNTHTYSSTASIGIALFNGREKVSEDLLRHADIAMYESKSEGRNTLRFFDPAMQEVINGRAKVERELRVAIAQHQFELYYQVQVGRDGEAVGAEALIRWRHPERGIVFPLDFIPLAEEVGLILAIGKWVIDTACLQLKAWQKMPLANDLVLAVNVSAKQFHQKDFVEQVYTAIERHGVNPALLKLELTESMLLNDIDNIILKIHRLKAIGVQFSLDDFGTGYSSLQYLKKLPLTQLKIDKSFVRDLTSNAGDRAIVSTIIAMAQSFGIEVIAEGVETAEQQKCLLDKGCFYYQGYLFSKPLPIDAFEALLKKKRIHFDA